ncbi:penicillin-insensitive murein endopeptidase [Oceanisphaera avium]|uniref:Penicillin-insensitive murein endopeptidase n=1 Tax=Oceanisphaera avium TaxID=1903694 RepID=A0A1Y0D0I0_9GAMM|nr:penicillin-insensitive murein endopeptidase [Oceanisphaera avium]
MLISSFIPRLVWAQAVGGYAAGCQFDSQALPLQGPGFKVIRASRERFYGQPALINYLQVLGKKVQQAQLPSMLIADIAMERGGPFPYGHRSHQTGLDADIWLRSPPVPAHQLEDIPEIDMVNHSLYTLTRHFKDQQRQLIALAATDPRVSRIFVHPLIKQAMCQAYPHAPWLPRLRPWYGHSGHFHVRLHCPKEDIHCVPQAPAPPGTGCGSELTSWLKDKTGALSTTGSRTPYRPELPLRCQSWVKQ